MMMIPDSEARVLTAYKDLKALLQVYHLINRKSMIFNLLAVQINH